MFLVRFRDRHSEGGHTHLTTHNGVLVVGEPAGGAARRIPEGEATRFDTEEAAFAALGRFIAVKGKLTDGDWIANPHVVERTPVPLASVAIGDRVIALSRDKAEYVVEDGERFHYIELRHACAAYGAAIHRAITEQGL